MNLRKHLAGLALFSIILGSAIFINHFLNTPNLTLASVPLHLPFSDLKEKPQSISYRVKQVSLDFINKKSHTELTLERQPAQPVPEKLWVTTFFFSPDYPGGVWMSKAEISQPFAQSDRIDVVAAAFSGLSLPESDTPKAGYFARVYVSTESADNSYPSDVQLSRDIRTALPVVVDWPDGNIFPANPTEKSSSSDHTRKFYNRSSFKVL
ncbi:MAG: hypothetical protein QOJ02_2299 [Acidobacteriota bacterium]|nr:hypothetical protein [Acidobacteriota bacterium]